MKKHLLLIPFASMLLSSCFWINDYGGIWIGNHSGAVVEVFYAQRCPIVNLAEDEYQITGSSLDVYFFDETEDVPYIDLKGFIKSFDGFFESQNITLESNYDSTVWRLTYGETHSVFFDCTENKITAASYLEFYWFPVAGSSTNHNEHLQRTNDYYFRDSTFEVDLDDYGFDLKQGTSHCFLPLFIANTLFCSLCGVNLYCNWENVYVTVGETRSLPEYYNCSFNNRNQSRSMRIAAVGSLCFTFDILYGLKEEKGYTHFDECIDETTLNLLYSTTYQNNFDAYKNIVYKQLDELHTRLDLPSYFCDTSHAKVTNEDYGDFYSEFYDRRAIQKELRDAVLTSPEEVRFEDDMAIITLDSFSVGTIAQIYDEDHNVKDDAWKYDSYHYMHYCMNQIENHGGINKIVLDLSLNGGGSLAAMERVAGFMTDDKIPASSYDTLDNEYVIDGYVVDIDGDDDYEDEDAYDEYDWYLLTGINTFSAANLMSSTFKDMNLGKIIGKKSGGGTCSILSLVLADGTGITISSTYTMRHIEEKENGEKDFLSIEHGIEPDVDFAYEDFYDSAALLSVINSITE